MSSYPLPAFESNSPACFPDSTEPLRYFLPPPPDLFHLPLCRCAPESFSFFPKPLRGSFSLILSRFSVIAPGFSPSELTAFFDNFLRLFMPSRRFRAIG